MSEPEYDELRAASWRRRLSPAEEARVQTYLAAHPQAQADWEDELALTRQLQELPDAPLSSNFTSLVLQNIDAQTSRLSKSSSLASRWRAWVGQLAPRIAVATMAVVLGLLVFLKHEHENDTRRQVAKDVEKFFNFASLPTSVAGPETFEDFDA